MNRVLLWKDKDEECHVAFMANKEECTTWGGLNVCDSCNGTASSNEKYGYLVADLMEFMCEKCFKKYKKDSVWYTEDTNAQFNNVLSCALRYGFNLSEEEINSVNKFFEEHRHCEIKLEKFLRGD